METAIKDFLSKHPAFTTREFADMLRIETPGIGRATIFHILKTLCDNNEITRTHKGHFDVAGKKDYFYEPSDMAKEISSEIHAEYPLVLHNPDMDEYHKYAGKETIVVRKLISEAPPSFSDYRQASLEKILVDLFGRGISSSIISRSEYQAIYEDSFDKYNINQARLFRYARRRGIEKTILDFIHNETCITLEADK